MRAAAWECGIGGVEIDEGKVNDAWQRRQHTGLEFLEEGWTVQMRSADAPLASVVTTG